MYIDQIMWVKMIPNEQYKMIKRRIFLDSMERENVIYSYVLAYFHLNTPFHKQMNRVINL